MATATRSSADVEVTAVGQWKPISCGEPEFVQSSVVEQRVCFSWNCGVRVPGGPRDHRFSIGNTTFISACIATGIFASTSFARFYVEFTA